MIAMAGRLSALLVAVILPVVLAFPGQAAAPDTSLIPVLRPKGLAARVETLPRTVRVPVYFNPTHLPVLRPSRASALPERTADLALIPASIPGVWRSLRPVLRPEGLAQRAVAAAPRNPARTQSHSAQQSASSAAAAAASTFPTETRAERRRRERAERRETRRASRTGGTSQPRRGSVCGDPAIRGEDLAPVSGNLRGCRINNPVRITEVDGVRLTQAATVNCETARALKTWINDGVRPAVGRLGGGVESLRVVASYSCRTRNSRPGARLSEHASGNAIDIAAVNLANGSDITVLGGWQDQAQGRVLRRMHAAACGPFGTVLGPDSDRNHRDHFHFDVAGYRSGPYCR